MWLGGRKADYARSRTVVVGDSIIYLISSVLYPPTSVVTEAVSDLRLSTFVASVYAASLDKVLARQPAVTYLVPDNTAFTSLGLVMSYLLLPVARAELRSLIRYHAIDEIVYLDDFPVGRSTRYPTLDDGGEIYVDRDDSHNGSSSSSVTVHGPTVGGVASNGETRDARIVEGDILTSTGVIHIIDQVELPPELDITIVKLLQGAKANTMVDLIRAANMSWVLEGKQPPASFFGEDEDEDAVGTTGLGKRRKHPNRVKRKTTTTDRAYTILCPTDKAFSRLNLTYYLSNPPLLSALVQLHIIPTDAFAPLTTDGRPLLLEDEIAYPTLLDDVRAGGRGSSGDNRHFYGTVAFRRWGNEGWLVGIKSARGTNGQADSAKVVSFGRASPRFLEEDDGPSPSSEARARVSMRRRVGAVRLAAGGGVLTIDSVLVPYQPG
jgi:uncharacterized surface protein with fasciclin (FAS1) repeats